MRESLVASRVATSFGRKACECPPGGGNRASSDSWSTKVLSRWPDCGSGACSDCRGFGLGTRQQGCPQQVPDSVEMQHWEMPRIPSTARAAATGNAIITAKRLTVSKGHRKSRVFRDVGFMALCHSYTPLTSSRFILSGRNFFDYASPVPLLSGSVIPCPGLVGANAWEGADVRYRTRKPDFTQARQFISPFAARRPGSAPGQGTCRRRLAHWVGESGGAGIPVG